MRRSLSTMLALPLLVLAACRTTYEIPAAELPRFDGVRRGTVRGVRTTDGDRVDIEAEDLLDAVPEAREGFSLMTHPRGDVANAVADGHVTDAQRAGWSELQREFEMPMRARIVGEWLVLDDGKAPPLAIPAAVIDHVAVARQDAAKTTGLVFLCLAGAGLMTAVVAMVSSPRGF